MFLNTYTNDDFYKPRCIECSWILDESFYSLKRSKKLKSKECSNCGNVGRYQTFPFLQSAHILGGLVYFIDSYNKRIKTVRHIFPPQVYLPIIFACSNYETQLADLVKAITNKYGKYVGRLGRMMIFDEVLRKYDRRANQALFKKMTLTSISKAIQEEHPNYWRDLERLYEIRNNVVHGKKIDEHDQAFDNVNKSIDFLLESVNVFKYLHNTYESKFLDNINYRKVLRMNKDEIFEP